MSKTITIILAGMITATALSIAAAAFAKKALEAKPEEKPDEDSGLTSNPLVHCKNCAYHQRKTDRCILRGTRCAEYDGCTDGERNDDA